MFTLKDRDDLLQAEVREFFYVVINPRCMQVQRGRVPKIPKRQKHILKKQLSLLLKVHRYKVAI